MHPCLLSPYPNPRQPTRTGPGGGSGLHKKKKPSNTFQHPLEKRVAGTWSRKKAEREGEVYSWWGKKKKRKNKERHFFFKCFMTWKSPLEFLHSLKKKLYICKSQKGMLFVGNWLNKSDKDKSNNHPPTSIYQTCKKLPVSSKLCRQSIFFYFWAVTFLLCWPTVCSEQRGPITSHVHIISTAQLRKLNKCELVISTYPW